MKCDVSKAARFGFSILVALSLSVVPVGAQQKVPDTLLRVTVQQKEKGKVNPPLHVQELRCSNGECSLTSITLNSCRPSPVSTGVASPVIVERSSTIARNLKVAQEGNTLVVIESGADIAGDYLTTQRFTYEKTPAGKIVDKLIGYSGGFVKNSIIAQQVITIEFVPLRGTFKEVKLDCPLGLPGVEVLK